MQFDTISLGIAVRQVNVVFGGLYLYRWKKEGESPVIYAEVMKHITQQIGGWTESRGINQAIEVYKLE